MVEGVPLRLLPGGGHALAAGIVGGRRVGPTPLARLGFAALEALQSRAAGPFEALQVALRERSSLPPELTQVCRPSSRSPRSAYFMERRCPAAGLGLR
ncbi:MAG TPA: hypothetical protein VFS43_05755 [Polyangiaceae bacterium]|nr:hypothetical protein [Polyangiaceae bacterium]